MEKEERTHGFRELRLKETVAGKKEATEGDGVGQTL